MPNGSKKAIVNRNTKRAAQAKIKCDKGCGRTVAAKGQICGTCRAQEK